MPKVYRRVGALEEFLLKREFPLHWVSCGPEKTGNHRNAAINIISFAAHQPTAIAPAIDNPLTFNVFSENGGPLDGSCSEVTKKRHFPS
jgi:hypothetical protein